MPITIKNSLPQELNDLIEWYVFEEIKDTYLEEKKELFSQILLPDNFKIFTKDVYNFSPVVRRKISNVLSDSILKIDFIEELIRDKISRDEKLSIVNRLKMEKFLSELLSSERKEIEKTLKILDIKN